jgi:hypothetical protein
MATDPATFFIRINLPDGGFQLEEDICLDNGKTKERLLTKMEKTWEVVLQISRYPLASSKNWIVANEKEILNWYLSSVSRRTICLTKELEVVPI